MFFFFIGLFLGARQFAGPIGWFGGFLRFHRSHRQHTIGPGQRYVERIAEEQCEQSNSRDGVQQQDSASARSAIDTECHVGWPRAARCVHSILFVRWCKWECVAHFGGASIVTGRNCRSETVHRLYYRCWFDFAWERRSFHADRIAWGSTVEIVCVQHRRWYVSWRHH